ncbi:MAG: 3-oxoacyl-ACP reductase FabG [Candidatus Anaerobiospirillum merdipullorum]|uniref:3-oxoacyl-[acyl-carrier-protein] reductase n=1 Tax=Candidatus Anaerobiospirillum merdipullorum TaxID=2838450 RepID=A0A9E2NSA8_9GAMM|nr:3-oxoacyl-ACP reductase FabG [Candidatus Anaerobiospirillum merdipullorum]
MAVYDFTGKVVLVTGASRGIGRVIAEEFVKAGAVVAGTATSEAGACKLESELTALEASGKAYGFVHNALDLSAAASLVAAVTEKCGAAPEILVNNAGITRDGLFMRMKDQDWDDVIACNLSAIARLTKACISPMMKKRSGRVISITSVVGEIGNAGQCNYAAAKAGIIGFSRSLAKEVGARGVTVNCVAPGFIETDMTKVLPEAALQHWLENIPLKRMGQALDIARAVLFLASDDAAYITGATLDVNGGMRCA